MGWLLPCYVVRESNSEPAQWNTTPAVFFCSPWWWLLVVVGTWDMAELMELVVNPPKPWPNWQAPVSTRELAGHHEALMMMVN